MTRVVALVATIPERRKLCERLLGELARQSRPPDAVILVLDGYRDHPDDVTPAPECSLPLLGLYRGDKRQGPGHRWYVAVDFLTLPELRPMWPRVASLDPDDIIVCVDDDAVLLEAPEFIAGLVMAVEREGGAAAAMGRDAEGRFCPPGSRSRGHLMHAAGLGLTVRAKHLVGLGTFAAEVVKAGGPDGLGPQGDDDALVSAFLWKQGIPIWHAATGNIFEAPASKATSFSMMRLREGQARDEQKDELRRVTGWPFVASARVG